MKTWLRALLGTIVLVVAIEASPFAQSFNQQIQQALNAIGYTNSTSQFSQYSKSFVFPANSYLNFGGSFGSSSYGFRDNGGQVQYRNSTGSWLALPTGGAPSSLAKYILQQPDSSAPNAQALSALATGVVLNTTTTGVLTTSLLLPATNFPALTGPITTVAGALATSVTAQSLTYGDIQSETASTLLGRGSASAGSPQEITLGAGMALTGTVLSSTAAAVAGANTQVQYNNSGAFGASANFTWTNGSSLLTITGTTQTLTELIGNNTPSLTSPKNSAWALNQDWNSAFGSAAFDGAQLTTVWNTTGAASGQSEALIVSGAIQGTQAMTGNLYAFHSNLDDQSTGLISEMEASRNESRVESGASATQLYGVTAAQSIAAGGTVSLLREFYAYSPQVAGTLSTEGVEYFGDDPLASGCTKCTSEYLYFGSRGAFTVAASPLASNNAGHGFYSVNLQNTITLNADLGTGSPTFVNLNADVTPSATWSSGTIGDESSYITIHGTHQVTTAVLGGFAGVGTDGSTSFTDTANGLQGLQVGWDYGSNGTAAQISSVVLYAGDAGGGVITNGSELWLQQPYSFTGVVTNYAALLIDNQTWPGSTTNYAILYNAPAGKTFGVLANGNVQLGGATVTFPATNSAGALVNNGTGTLSWSSTGLFPLLAPAGTSTAPSYSWSTATGVGLYQPSTNQTGIVGGLILGKTASAANGSILYVSGSGIAASAAPLIQISLSPGLDSAQTIPVGQNADGLLISPVFTTAGSGTHALVANVELGVGTWTAGGAIVTEAATLYIDGPPTIGVNKYALHVAAGQARFDAGTILKPTVFASVPASPATGTLWAVSDSTTQTWGATVSGGGSSFALIIFDGANWTVAAK